MGEITNTFTSVIDTVDGVQLTFQLTKGDITEPGNVTYTGQLGAIDPQTFEQVREHTFQIVSHSANCPNLDCSIKGEDWECAKIFRFFLTEEFKQNPDDYLQKPLTIFNYHPMSND